MMQLQLQSQHEAQLWSQKVNALELYLQETKDNLQQLQRQFAEEREQQRVHSMEERKQTTERLDNLMIENGKKERELMKLEQEIHSLTSQLTKYQDQYQLLQEDHKAQNEQEGQKIYELQEIINEMKQEIIEKRIEGEREKALLLQERMYSERKIEELQNKLVDCQKDMEEKGKLQKMEIQNELEQKVFKLKEEKKIIEQELETQKFENSELIKIQNQQQEEISRLQNFKQSQEKQIDSLRSEWEIKNQLSEGERQALLNNWQEEFKNLQYEIDRLKQENLELDAYKNEIQTNYERDQLLWESKFKFLEKQKDEAKSDWADSIKKFELTLQHMKKARQTDREDHEGQLNEILQTIEKKHQNEIQDLNETNSRIISEFSEKIKNQEREIKLLTEKISSSQGKYGNTISLEIKFNELVEKEKKYRAEIERLKAENSAKSNEYNKFIDQERENWRTKVSDIDSKYKLVESKRTQMIFDFEKERAKWNLSKDHLDVKIKELQDNYDKLFRKYESQGKELEKLKNESRVSRRSINLMGVNQTNDSITTSTVNLNPGMNNNIKDPFGKPNFFNQSDLMSDQTSQYSTKQMNSKYEMNKNKPQISWSQMNNKKESKYY